MLPIDQNKLLQLASRITTVNYLTVQLCQDNYIRLDYSLA